MSNLTLEAHSAQLAAKVAGFLDRYFAGGGDLYPNHRRLLESMRYSLLQEGGKRFRPVLAMLTAEALGRPVEAVLPFAGAVECVHTYSLIHDDLPAMDNDDFRRGKPTNHKVFGDATAILAGDALLTDAFQMIADSYHARPAIAVALVSQLASASGFRGMVGGQAIDMGAKKDAIDLDELRTMHRLKTGALIKVAAMGAATVCEAGTKQLSEIGVFADNLGLAFQVADDLLDYDPAKPEPGSYPALLGRDGAERFLGELTEACLQSLASWPESADRLRQIARFNRQREH